ncbi:hypothetical protein Cni_G14407 [Canna indica]|uniref:Uncharacterized protein n=1 Tax=Canna indica TaxID=4628 RepID=A0AAQ3KEV6_9LILI|nr:hypothetical protein Cni_G14407 [Canna indica]
MWPPIDADVSPTSAPSNAALPLSALAMADDISSASPAPKDDYDVRDKEEEEPSFSPRGGGDPVGLDQPRRTRRRKAPPPATYRGSRNKLFDIIQHVQYANRAGTADGNSSTGTRWNSLKDRFRGAGAAWSTVTSGQPYPVFDPELLARRPNNALARTISHTTSVRNPYSISDPELILNRPSPVRPRSISILISVRNSEPLAPQSLASVAEPEEQPAHGGGGGRYEEFSFGQKSFPGAGGGDYSPQAEEQQESTEPTMSLMALLEQDM